MERCGESVSTTAAKLGELFEVVPDEIVDYFEQSVLIADLRGHFDEEIHPLTIDESQTMTKEFRSFHPVVAALGGVILDDPNTSNHHIYLSMKPCDGTVLYLDHDGVTRIVFPTLSAFVEASQTAVATGDSIREVHPDSGIVVTDQCGLSRLIEDMYEKGFDRETNDVILALIPSMDLRDFTLLHRLAVDPDFYIAEAFADTIACRPRSDLKPLAELCTQHPHSQASRAGSRASAAIRAITKN